MFFIAAFMVVVLPTGSFSQNVKSDSAGQKTRSTDNFTEQDDFRRTYQLAPGAKVELSVIYGPTVEIETTNSDQAEVYIIRSAPTREDLDRRKINVEQAANSLTIRGDNDSTRNSKVRQRVLLKLPRKISLSVNNIFAPVTVGEIDGTVRLDNISGPVTVAQAVGCADVSQISGPLTLTVANLDACGVRINHVSGPVTLRLIGELNADAIVSDFNGQVNLTAENTTALEKTQNSVKARLGSGGVPISISNISGGVTFILARTTTSEQ